MRILLLALLVSPSLSHAAGAPTAVALRLAGTVLANGLGPTLKPVNRVQLASASFGPRGFVEFRPAGDTILTRREMEAQLDTSMGGAIAEQLVAGRRRLVEEDMKQTMGLAHMMSAVGHGPIHKIVAQASERVRSRLQAQRRQLELLAAALDRRGAMTGEEIDAVMVHAALSGAKGQ